MLASWERTGANSIYIVHRSNKGILCINPPGQVGPSTFRARAEAEANQTQTFLVARFQIDICVPWGRGSVRPMQFPLPPRGGSSCGRYAALLVSTHPSLWGTEGQVKLRSF